MDGAVIIYGFPGKTDTWFHCNAPNIGLGDDGIYLALMCSTYYH